MAESGEWVLFPVSMAPFRERSLSAGHDDSCRCTPSRAAAAAISARSLTRIFAPVPAARLFTVTHKSRSVAASRCFSLMIIRQGREGGSNAICRSISESWHPPSSVPLLTMQIRGNAPAPAYSGKGLHHSGADWLSILTGSKGKDVLFGLQAKYSLPYCLSKRRICRTYEKDSFSGVFGAWSVFLSCAI